MVKVTGVIPKQKSMYGKIYKIPSKEVDVEKWDQALYQMKCFRPEASTAFLGSITHWDALIMEDYSAFMPLTYRQQFFWKKYVQPIWAQQLGVFEENPGELLPVFIEFLVKKQIRFHLHFHEKTDLRLIPGTWKVIERPNFILSLDRSYAVLYKNFSNHTRRHIKKCLMQNFQLNWVESSEEKIPAHVWEILKLKIHYNDLRKLKKWVFHQNLKKNIKWAFIYDNGVLSGVGIFGFYPQRIIYHAGVMKHQTRQKGGFYFLFNRLIEQYSCHDLLLDFEGSKIPGVARFFAGFGSHNQPFFEIVN